MTCGDIAEEMLILAIDRERGLALCEDPGGARHTVEIALVQPVADTDTLLVHAGTAIQNNSRHLLRSRENTLPAATPRASDAAPASGDAGAADNSVEAQAR